MSHGVLKSFKYNGLLRKLAIHRNSSWITNREFGGVGGNRSFTLVFSIWIDHFGFLGVISTSMTYRLRTRARLWNFKPWLILPSHLQHEILGPVMFHMTRSSTSFPMQLLVRFDFC